MISYPYGALYAGTLFVLAGIMTMARHFLLEPGTPNYPKAPAMVRAAMFLFASGILFLGLQYLMIFFVGYPDTTPPQPTARMQFLATIIFLYKSVLLVNVAIQRYPEEVWTKLNRLNDALPCKNRAFIRVWFGK